MERVLNTTKVDKGTKGTISGVKKKVWGDTFSWMVDYTKENSSKEKEKVKAGT